MNIHRNISCLRNPRSVTRSAHVHVQRLRKRRSEVQGRPDQGIILLLAQLIRGQAQEYMWQIELQIRLLNSQIMFISAAQAQL